MVERKFASQKRSAGLTAHPRVIAWSKLKKKAPLFDCPGGAEDGIYRMTDGVYVRAVYDLIVNSADVVRGVFCGHRHVSMVSQILAKTPAGEDKIIPQYVNHAAFSDKGHVLKITVK